MFAWKGEWWIILFREIRIKFLWRRNLLSQICSLTWMDSPALCSAARRHRNCFQVTLQSPLELELLELRTWSCSWVSTVTFSSFLCLQVVFFYILYILYRMKSYSQETKFKTAVTACYFSKRFSGSSLLEYLSECPLTPRPSFSIENMEKFLKNEGISRGEVLLNGCSLKPWLFQDKSLPFFASTPTKVGLSQWLSGKESACDAEDTGDLDSIPVSGRSHREGNGYPLQYSCLGNPMDREAWWATVLGSQRVGRDWSD